jgi:nucleoside-diphosphate-sugar epimerase
VKPNAPNPYVLQAMSKISLQLERLEGKRVAILGSSGFVGSWLTEILMEAVLRGVDCRVDLVSRTGNYLPASSEALTRKMVRVHKVDISKNIPSEIFENDYFVLAATSSTPQHGSTDESMLKRTSRGLLKFLETLGEMRFEGEKNLVHLSSGAVYKVHRSTRDIYLECEELTEHSTDTYTNSKVMLELATRRLESAKSSWKIANPRIFTLYGPGLPLNAHFAIGNFVDSVIQKREIVIRGNPLTVRSYLHIADLCVAIFKILLEPTRDPLNLGSGRAMTIRQLAELIGSEFPQSKISELKSDLPPSFYVPDISKTVARLGNLENIDFKTGVRDWIEWLLSRNNSHLVR